MSGPLVDAAAWPALARLAEGQLAAFPEHRGYLQRRLAGAADLAFAEDLAGDIERIMGDQAPAFFADYRWLAGAILEEELFFRRHGRYRLTTFEEAERQVYADAAYMTRYVNGILLSQLWWANHCQTLAWFRDRYLPGNPEGTRHLEVGPGHGLFLHLAARDGRTADAVGWDVSPASLASVRHTFAALGSHEPALTLVNLMEGPEGAFGSVTFSEVLEHLERPGETLARLRRVTAPGGRLFLNAPVNSPAPDHITLFRAPEEIVELTRAAGFEVETVLLAPPTGSSLARARAHSLTISTVIFARRPLKDPA